jgi:hypothetical protein
MGLLFPKVPTSNLPTNRPLAYADWTVGEGSELSCITDNCTYQWRSDPTDLSRPEDRHIDQAIGALSWGTPWSPVNCANVSKVELLNLRANQPASALPVCWGGLAPQSLPKQFVQYVALTLAAPRVHRRVHRAQFRSRPMLGAYGRTSLERL